jgi:ABC-type phosphate transport system substrate-binding protein
LFLQRCLYIFVLAISSAQFAGARDIALVSNKGNAVHVLSVAELVKVCKAEISRWPDGKPVTFVMRSPSAPEMQLVLAKVYGLSPAEVDSLIASSNRGRTSHPAIVIATSDEDLVEKVSTTPGAVGVIDVYSINSSVSVLKIAGKLPLEPGYLLHGN